MKNQIRDIGNINIAIDKISKNYYFETIRIIRLYE